MPYKLLSFPKKNLFLIEKFRNKEESFAIPHQLFCDSICSVLLLRLTSLDPPPENGIAMKL
jgi:hypothetical protein